MQQTLNFTVEQEERIQKRAVDLINKVRTVKKNQYGVDALMQEFSLGDDEGIRIDVFGGSIITYSDNQT